MSRSSTIAVVLAGLAVVIAATGTAVAVTAGKVNIADPVTPTRIAHVDSSGRLTTINPAAAVATYSYSGLLVSVNADNNFVTAPTTARLVLTSVSLSHPGQVAGQANTNLRVVLYKVNSSSTTTCVATGYKQLFAWNLEPGDDISENFGIPLAVAGTGAMPYCLSLYVYPIAGGTYAAGFYPFGSATWYVSSGTYKAPAAADRLQSPAQVRRQSGVRTDR